MDRRWMEDGWKMDGRWMRGKEGGGRGTVGSPICDYSHRR